MRAPPRSPETGSPEHFRFSNQPFFTRFIPQCFVQAMLLVCPYQENSNAHCLSHSGRRCPLADASVYSKEGKENVIAGIVNPWPALDEAHR